MKTVQDYVDAVFSENGIIVQLGGRYTSEQHQYAKSIAECLEDPSKCLGLLQADTGIGKSLGYLVPSFIYVALHPNLNKKIVVSTFTRHLQKQIIDHDVPFIEKIISKLGLNAEKILVAYRMGRQSFFSVDRVAYKCKTLIRSNPDRRNELDTFLNYVVDSCKHGSGLWLDYIEEIGDLPSGIKTQDICLLNSQKPDNESYSLHLEYVESADIVVTNHHSCIMADRTGLDKFSIHAMIFDESHKLASICFDNFNYRSNLNDLKRLLKLVSDYPRANRAALLCVNYIDELENKVHSHPRFKEIEYFTETITPVLFSECKAIVLNIYKTLSKVQSIFKSEVGLASVSIKEAEFIDESENIISSLRSWQKENNKYNLSAIGISPIKKQISIAYLNINASRLFGLITKNLTDRIILTSATLANAQKNMSFDLIKSSLGLYDLPIVVENVLSPKEYADMRFVLMSKSCPSPISNVNEDQIVFNEKWLCNTALMIKKAKESGENILVLTNSHYESKILAKAIEELKPLVHQQGHPLKEYVSDFKQPNQILITCAGWEGLNLRGHNGEQLIHHVLISRIPYSPPNPIIEFAIKNHYKSKNQSDSTLMGIQWFLSVQDVISKLKQGFGRGTRSPNDLVTIWIADSRMPHSRNEKGNLVLLNAIPSRFMGNYLNAEIFLEMKKELFFI